MKKILLSFIIILAYCNTINNTNAESVSCYIANWSWTKTIETYNLVKSALYDCWDCSISWSWPIYKFCKSTKIWWSNCIWSCRETYSCEARTYWSCTVSSCNSGYTKSWNSCVANPSPVNGQCWSSYSCKKWIYGIVNDASYDWVCTWIDWWSEAQCYLPVVKINGWWTSRSYGSRGSCDSSTGKEERSGTRSCTNPSASWWWDDCSWSTTTTQSRNCDVDGWWTSWTYDSWGSCDSSTWIEERDWTRSCTNPSQQNGWLDCTWSTTTTQTQNCDVDGWWTSWSYGARGTCNSSTWEKTRSLTRTCTNPTPQNSGDDCSWSSSTTESTTCIVDWGWSSWSSWGVCTSSSQSRSRSCTNPSPKNGWLACSGSSTDSQWCDSIDPTVWVWWIRATWGWDDTVTISCSDAWSGCDSDTYQFRISSANFTCNSSWSWNNGISYVATSKTYICFRAKDSIWNGYSYSSTELIKVDNTDPDISATNFSNLWKWSNIWITLEATDSWWSWLSQARYSWANNLNGTCTGGWDPYINNATLTKTNSNNATLYLCARDIAGNTNTWNGIYKLDKIMPSNVDITWISTTWVQSDTVNIICSDSLSGCNTWSIQYTVKSTNFTCNQFASGWTNNTSYTTTNRMYICARAKDEMWNGYRYSNTEYINKVDSDKPTFTVSYNPVIPTWNNSGTEVSIACIDPLSWCDMYNITDWTISWNTYKRTFTANTSSGITIRDKSTAKNTEIVNYDVTNIDTDLPNGTINYTNSWTKNTAQSVIFTTNDTWGSWVDNYSLEMRSSTNSPAFTTWSTWSSVSTTSSPYNYTWVNETAYQYRLVVNDVAGNTNTITEPYTTKIDTITPNSWDISSIGTPNNTKFEAWDFPFNAKVDINNGSPISIIEWYFEDQSTINSYWILQSSNSDNNSWVTDELEITWYFNNIDNDSTPNNWERTYSFKITKIIDEALNEISNPSWIKIFNYDVYADSVTINTSVPVNDLIIWNTADWSINNLTLRLRDQYWNKIIPNTSINRTIDFDFNVTNSLYLNQYEKTWDSVFLNTTNDSSFTNKLTTSSWFVNEQSITWDYNYQFKVFTPTYDPTWSWSYWEKLANWEMIMTSINFDINQNTFINRSNITITDSTFNLKFKPLFKTEYKWDFKNMWIHLNTIQTSEIDLTKEPTISILKTTWPTPEILVEFWKNGSWSNILHPNFTFHYKPDTDNNIMNEGNQSDINLLQPVWSLTSTGLKSFDFKVTHDTGTTTSNNTYLSSHVRYVLNDPIIWDVWPIVYDSDVVNKIRYVDWTGLVANTNQLWLKVLWRIQSKNQQDLIAGQTWTDLYQLWNNTKSELKELIHKQVSIFTRNITPANNFGLITDLSWTKWEDNLNGTKLKNNTIMYYKLNPGTNLVIWNWSDLVAQWIKTLIVEWWNVYIKDNITYSNNSTDNLWIIVLEDENDNTKWWNIYIDTNVTHIVWTYFADKSVISYDGTNEIDWSVTTNILKNQLYIYGTLFTENTIGWSIKTVAKCPYYVTVWCTRDIAKKYDLNFLRRYFVYAKDWDGLKNDIYDLWSWYYSFWDDNFTYPVIIEYNPNIQVTPPPVFSNE